jgi:replication-associated recombination protein RarA
MIPFSELTSVGGYLLGEVASALQKSIRRGDEDGALFWSTELDLSGYQTVTASGLMVGA